MKCTAIRKFIFLSHDLILDALYSNIKQLTEIRDDESNILQKMLKLSYRRLAFRLVTIFTLYYTIFTPVLYVQYSGGISSVQGMMLSAMDGYPR